MNVLGNRDGREKVGLLGRVKALFVRGSRPARPSPKRSVAFEPLEGRQLLASRVALSVITETNLTTIPLVYDLKWQGQSTWQRYTINPGQTQVLTVPRQSAYASVRFDESFAPGYQERSLVLPSKNFVASGLENWQPSARTHGMPFTFQFNTYRTGVVETGDLSLDTTRHAAQRAIVDRDFASLRGVYEVLGSQTPVQSFPDTYNCIAWSEGVTTRWVWPGETLASFDTEYARSGFRRLSTLDTSLQAGVLKICLYAKDGKMTHAALQNSDGTWSSKLGSDPLIRHLTADVFGSTSYGRPVAIYARLA